MTARPRVAVASRSFSRHSVLRAELLARYPGATFNDEGRALSGADLVHFLSGHDMAIIALERIDDSILSQLPELKVIAKYGVGLDGVDLDALRRHGVRLGWRGGVNRRSVAELVVALSICLLRHVVEGDRLVRRGGWQQLIGRQLSGRTVGIIGCGHVGKEVAVLMRAFGCRVLAHDIRVFPEFYEAHEVKAVDLGPLLRQADIVTVHLPLDETTRNVLSAERLGCLKKQAILINTARGGLVDERAVARMLQEGRLSGVAFDVFAVEPPGRSALLDLPNFVATPHIGGHSEEAILAMGRAAIDGLSAARDPFEAATL